MTQENEGKQDTLMLDVSVVQNSTELYRLLKEYLELPCFYGMNWDAITGLIELPETLIFRGWRNIEEKLPRDSHIFINLLNDFNEQYPHRKYKVVYQ
ncbi:barstar family protein [Priestia koreensis]|uniref:Barnase inhibitor n=1 Tax=Priestia koreensis TaxID=284581 RepID=A0A0M0KW34_9BACI|nr:barstar family protein [Priestia koreensis]KOO43030.1 barnase inhibitor [Priestia koreensis]